MKKEIIEQIREALKERNAYQLSSNSMKARPVGCPMQKMCIPELQGLSKFEFHAAFFLGIIGNNGHQGTVLLNAKK